MRDSPGSRCARPPERGPTRPTRRTSAPPGRPRAPLPAPRLCFCPLRLCVSRLHSSPRAFLLRGSGVGRCVLSAVARPPGLHRPPLRDTITSPFDRPQVGVGEAGPPLFERFISGRKSAAPGRGGARTPCPPRPRVASIGLVGVGVAASCPDPAPAPPGAVDPDRPLARPECSPSSLRADRA